MRRFTLALLLLLPLSAQAEIATTRESEDFTGTLSQIECDVDPASLASWQNHPSYPAPDLTLNGDGTMTVVTPGTSYPNWQLVPGNYLDSATGWTWETRFRIDSANDPDRGVWEIYLRDNDSGLAATRIHFLATGLDRDNRGSGVDAEIAANLTDGFHVVRAAVEGGTNLTTVWLDGVKVIEALPSNEFNASELGVIGRWGAQTGGGTTTIDSIRFDTTGAYAPPGSGSPGELPPASPCDGASIDRLQPLYWWPDGNATVYRVWFGTSSSFTTADFQGEFPVNSFNPGHLLENTSYHWRVDVVTATGTVAGIPWSFTTTTGNDLTPAESYLGWKLTHFPTAILLDPSKEATHWGDQADLDHDQLTTLLECAVGGDPFTPDADKLPAIGLDAGSPVVSFRQRTGATGTPGLDSSAWGLIYRIEAGPDLTIWHHGPSWVENTGPPTSNGDGTETATVRLPGGDPARWFARLAVFAVAP